MKKTLPLTSLVVALYLYSSCSIPLPSYGAGTSTTTFLELMPNARAMGLGEAYVALADEASALAWNPSGLANIKQTSIHAMYQLYLQGSSYQYLAGGYAIPGLGTIGVQIMMLGSGDIPKTTEDSSGELVDSGTNYQVSDMVAGAGWAMEFSPEIKLGAMVKWLQQQIATTTQSGLAFDFGAQWKPMSLLQLGASLQHLGGALAGETLPTTWRLGAATTIIPETWVVADVTQALGSDLSFHAGVEYGFFNLLALRAGYQTGLGTGGLTGFSAGLGGHLDNITIDYAIASMGDFGFTHRISAGYNF